MTALAYEFVPIKENHDPLVLLSSDSFILEPIYSTQGISSVEEMYLRKTVVEKLLKIQTKLKKYKFKIWDGYRSREVQKNIYKRFLKELSSKHPDWEKEKLFEEVSIFVTNPDKQERIPPHATGGSVDLTLVDGNGRELDMGTEFDFFGSEAAPFYYEENEIDEEIKNNRKLLREAMLAEDFSYDKDEWWHFNYGNQLWALQLNKEYALFGEIQI